MLSNTYHLHLRPGDQIGAAAGRTAPDVHLEWPDFDGQRRISGVFAVRTAKNHRGGRHLCQPHRRPSRFSWGLRRACRSRPISGRILPWPLTSASKTRRRSPTSARPCDRTLPLAGALQGGAGAAERSLPDAVNPHQMLWGINQGGDISGSAHRAYAAHCGARPSGVRHWRPGGGGERRR